MKASASLLLNSLDYRGRRDLRVYSKREVIKSACNWWSKIRKQVGKEGIKSLGIMNRYRMVNPYNGVLFNNKKEQSDNLDEPCEHDAK